MLLCTFSSLLIALNVRASLNASTRSRAVTAVKPLVPVPPKNNFAAKRAMLETRNAWHSERVRKTTIEACRPRPPSAGARFDRIREP